LVLRQHR